MVRVFDDGTFGPQLARRGTVLLDSRPEGAEAHVFRWEEGRDRRWLPAPYRPERNESRIPTGTAGEHALEFSDFNRLGRCPLPSLDLPSGASLFVLRRDGVEVRYPVRVGRETRLQGTVRMIAPAPGFVLVPEGEFPPGGDSLAWRSEEGGMPVPVPDFCLGRCEVTVGEYRGFVTALIAEKGPAAALQRVPRQDADSPIWRIAPGAKEPSLPANADLRRPVQAISQEDAEAYCAWRTRTEGGKIRYRLPSDDEWEKAARGPDGRFFPWGDSFDFLFVVGALSRPRPEGAEAVGTCAGDESPYGVLDLGGNVSEWCGGGVSGSVGRAYARGGSWKHDLPERFRAAARYGLQSSAPQMGVGFRLAYTPEE